MEAVGGAARHNSREAYFRSPFGAVPCKTRVTLRITAPEDVTRATARLWYGEKERFFPMKRSREGYEITVPMPETPCLVWYWFQLYTADGMYYLGKEAVLEPEGAVTSHQPHSFQITVYSPNLYVPEWMARGVMYQIFPDRFYNGSAGGPVHKKYDHYHVYESWGDPVRYDAEWENSEWAKSDFFGGNLKGIEEKLGYLKDLGVTVLYLNPIFEAYSNHRYDTGDYTKIDPMLGDEADFARLCEKAGEMGIRVVLDGVFSHTGIDSIYFNKRGTYPGAGAYQSKESPYYDWYTFKSYPDDYECWWGVTTLPNVKEMHPSYRDFIIRDPDSVVRRWLRLGASGWRLDVADELPDEFIRQLRRAAREEKKDAVIIGEVWEDASNKQSYGSQRRFLLGEELDSVMNYPFKDALLGFIMGWHGAEQFHRVLLSLRENYPRAVFYSLMNLIGGHDVIRARTLFSDAPDLPMEARAAYTPAYDELRLADKRLRMAFLVLLTFPGIPCIYYGDEIGMMGYGDPFNRGAMAWDGADGALLAFCKGLTGLRHRFPPLRTGEYHPVFLGGDVLCYKREITGGRDALGESAKDGAAYIVANRSVSSAHHIVVEGIGASVLYDALTGKKISTPGGRLSCSVPAGGALLYISEDLVHGGFE